MARETRSGVAFRPCRSGSSPSSTSSDSTGAAIGSPGCGRGLAIVAHTIYEVDAIAAAQALAEMGSLLRQNERERFRAKAFSAAAWSIAMQRPDLESLQRTESLTQIEGVGEGIARVLSDFVQTGQSRYLNRLREQMQQPARDDESELDFNDYQGDVHSHTNWSDGRATMLEMAQGAQALGYSYLGVTDHSPRSTVVHGLNAVRLVAQSREMAEVQKQVESVTLLQGIEVDILEDADAHAPAEFAYVPMALWMARRAGIEKERILNFRPLDELTMATQ